MTAQVLQPTPRRPSQDGRGVGGNNNIGIKKCTTNFLWVLNFGQVGGRRENFQNHTATMIFSKMVSNLSILRLKFGEI